MKTAGIYLAASFIPLCADVSEASAGAIAIYGAVVLANLANAVRVANNAFKKASTNQ